MQKSQPAAPIPLTVVPNQQAESSQDVERSASLWVSRLTGVIGATFTFIALFVWFARPGHYRLVLLFLTVAMFMSILHAYTFESGES